jgi:hypothetical protein
MSSGGSPSSLFATDLGVTIPYGCVGPAAKSRFSDGFGFVGSARNEGLNVFVAGLEGSARPIGCRGVCDALDALPDPSVVEVEERSDRNEYRLLIHLPQETWVFLLNASTQAGEPIWFRVITDDNGYRCRNAVKAYGLTIVGDTQSGAFGYITTDDARHFGIEVESGFDAGMLYNQGQGAIIDSIELVGLPGRGGDGAAFLSMTRDGETFSAERSVKLLANNRARRIAWRPHARIGNYLGLRFRFAGAMLPGIASLEAKLRGLSS